MLNELSYGTRVKSVFDYAGANIFSVVSILPVCSDHRFDIITVTDSDGNTGKFWRRDLIEIKKQRGK